MKNTRGEPSAGGQTAPRETSLSSCLFIPCRSLHCGTRCKHSNYALAGPSARSLNACLQQVNTSATRIIHIPIGLATTPNS